MIAEGPTVVRRPISVDGDGIIELDRDRAVASLGQLARMAAAVGDDPATWLLHIGL